MIRRHALPVVIGLLDRHPAVGLLGPRQVGKTTLAHAIAVGRSAVYLDLQDTEDRAKLSEPKLYFAQHTEKLIVLDEIQRTPDLFTSMRSQIDRGRREGHSHGQFLILGSASLDLLKQSAESLAGRIAYTELRPIGPAEIEQNRAARDRLWLRGGFPMSFTAKSDFASFEWRNAFIKTYLERDIPMLGPRVPAETLGRYWTMLAHNQGALLNAARIATALSVSGQTVARYLDLMVDLLLVRRLRPWASNAGKRVVKAPKVYVRDSGIVHALLGIQTLEQLQGHPVAGHSWEGMMIEALIAAAPMGTEAYFYRTSAGAEVDLVLALPGGRTWAIEVKRSLAPKIEKGFRIACDDIRPDAAFLLYAGEESYPIADRITAIGVDALIGAVTQANRHR